MKLSQLQKKYPKAFDKFFVSNKCPYPLTDDVLDSDARDYWVNITDFFDKNHIIMMVGISKKFNVFWGSIYLKDKDKKLFLAYDVAESKKRSRVDNLLIELAFSILEDRLS